MADQQKEFLRKLRATFRVEAEEHLLRIVSAIVMLEQNDGAAKDVVERILKELHTLKGAARAVNLSDMETLCHAMENVCSALARSAQALRPEEFDMLHQAATMARSLVEAPSGKARNQVAALAARLNRLGSAILARAESGSEAQAPAQPAHAPAGGRDEAVELAGDEAATPAEDVVRVLSRNLDAIRYQGEALLTVELSLRHHMDDLFQLADELAEQRERLRIAQAGRRAGRSRARPTPARRAADAGSDGPDTDRYYRRLESRCRDIASAMGQTRRNFATIRSGLMETVLETSLVPFSTALEQLPGLVRNLARGRGKEAVLDMEGEAVQIDRRVLGIVREALIHLVTNAVDHGIEPVEQRLAHGKQAAGRVQIKVAHRGNDIQITVADDGAGIDVERVLHAAMKTRHLHDEEAASLSDQQKLHLALHAGVSTSAEVTQVSGRGMGLAIVAEKVAAVGGEMTIENSAGAGCAFQLVLPVRLATLRALVLHTGGFVYAVPLSGVESVRALKEGDIEAVENRETLLVAGRVVPAIRLRRVLGLRAKGVTDTSENIAVIARIGGSGFALLVDDIVCEQEILPKSLGRQLRRVRYITGATQLGDGSLVPILGLEDIARYGFAVADVRPAGDSRQGGASHRKRVLVTEDSITSRLLLKHMLESAGYQVETAVDGLDALSKLRHADFDALVSDVEMPRMDGLALTKHLRANPKTAEMPVVLVTSLQSPEERERGLRAGADAYVAKGAFDQDNLMATIRRLI